MNIAIIGRTEVLFNTAHDLLKDGHRIKLIVTAKEASEYKKTAYDFKVFAKKIGAKFLFTPEVSSDENRRVVEKLGKLDIGVSVNYASIISQKVIDLFKYGILNAHMGDLPSYRGNACPNWAILKGEDKITLTVHFMEGGELDSGPIVLQRKFPILYDTTIGDVYKFYTESSPKMFRQALGMISLGRIKPRPQTGGKSAMLRCYPRIPSDSFIDWRKDARCLDKLVRASSKPFSGAYTYLKDKKLIIWRAYPSRYPCRSLSMPGQVLWRLPDKGEVAVACGKDILILQKVQIERESCIEASKIINSSRIRLGMMVEDEIAALKKRIQALENEKTIKKNRKGAAPAL